MAFPSQERQIAVVIGAAGELDHSGKGLQTPALAFRVYARAIRRDGDEKARLKALVEGGIVAVGGRREQNWVMEVVDTQAA